jgi:hypothetical protein
MADKVEKPKKSKAKREEKSVLGSLSSARPERIGTRRASAPGTAGAKTTSTTKTSAAAKKTAASAKKSSTTASKSRATATRRKAAAPRTFEPTQAAESAAGAADARAAGAVPRAAAPERRPRAVREGAPGMGTSGARPDPTSSARTGERAPASAGRADERSEAASPESARPSGVELVTTAVQAAGELTQIGLTIGGRIIKRAVDRIPRP